MIIILEGPDGSGKTTFANDLAAKFGFRVAHEGPPPQDSHPIQYYSDVLEQRRSEFPNWIFDRFAFGERIYGPWYRGKDGLGQVGWEIVKNRLRRRPFTDDHELWLHVLCLPPYEKCHAAWSSGREELIKDEHVFRTTYDLYQSYDYCFDHIVDYTIPGTYQELQDHISELLSPVDEIPLLTA